MNNLETQINNYLNYCENQKRLDKKTLKAYRIDLKQFAYHIPFSDISLITPNILEDVIASLHFCQPYISNRLPPKPTQKECRQMKLLICLHSFFYLLTSNEILLLNPRKYNGSILSFLCRNATEPCALSPLAILRL